MPDTEATSADAGQFTAKTPEQMSAELGGSGATDTSPVAEPIVTAETGAQPEGSPELATYVEELGQLRNEGETILAQLSAELPAEANFRDVLNNNLARINNIIGDIRNPGLQNQVADFIAGYIGTIQRGLTSVADITTQTRDQNGKLTGLLANTVSSVSVENLLDGQIVTDAAEAISGPVRTASRQFENAGDEKIGIYQRIVNNVDELNFEIKRLAGMAPRFGASPEDLQELRAAGQTAYAVVEEQYGALRQAINSSGDSAADSSGQLNIKLGAAADRAIQAWRTRA